MNVTAYYFLSIFPVCNAVLLTIAIILCVRSLDLFIQRNCIFVPFDRHFCISPPPQPLVTTASVSASMNSTFYFRFHIQVRLCSIFFLVSLTPLSIRSCSFIYVVTMAGCLFSHCWIIFSSKVVPRGLVVSGYISSVTYGSKDESARPIIWNLVPTDMLAISWNIV